MNPYFVKGRLMVSPYMGSSYTLEDNRIVMADSSSEARLKYGKYWDEKSESYGTSYYLESVYVADTIT